MSGSALAPVLEAFGSSVRVSGSQDLTTLDHSSVTRLRLEQAPVESVIVKASTGGTGLALAQREKRFYECIAPHLSPDTCPATYYLQAERESVVLVLEDIRGRTPRSDQADEGLIEQFVLTLAQLHSAAESIDNLNELWATAFTDHPYNTVVGRLDPFPARRNRFLHQHGTALNQNAHVVLDQLDKLQGHLASRDASTIVHGDAHFGNAIVSAGGLRIVDWANVALGFGELDLAHMLALNLPRSVGRELEQKMLSSYAAHRNRDEVEVIAAYKAGVLYAVTSSIGMWEFGVPEETWAKLLENALTAALELQAVEILNDATQ